MSTTPSKFDRHAAWLPCTPMQWVAVYDAYGGQTTCRSTASPPKLRSPWAKKKPYPPSGQKGGRIGPTTISASRKPARHGQ